MDQQLNVEPLDSIKRTNVEEVKKLNANSGLTYNEVKQMLAQKIRDSDKDDQ